MQLIYFCKRSKKICDCIRKRVFSEQTEPRYIKIPVYIFVVIIVLISIVLPILALMISTVSLRMGVFTLDNFTLDYWIGKSIPRLAGLSGILRNSDVLMSVYNSVRIVSIVAVLSGCLGTL